MSSRTFEYGCRRMQKNMHKEHGHVLGTRDACTRMRRRKIRPDRPSLSLISGPLDRSRPIDLSRARATSHARTHARHATRTRNAITRRRRTRSRSGKPSVLHPQPPIDMRLENLSNYMPKYLSELLPKCISKYCASRDATRSSQ